MQKLSEVVFGALVATSLFANAAMATEPVVVRVVPPASAMRVDPQAVSPYRLGGTTGTRGRGTVLVPLARTTFDVASPPPGYRTAWEDGRTNPVRGPRTLEGDYQMKGVWTNRTPQRLQPVIRISR